MYLLCQHNFHSIKCNRKAKRSLKIAWNVYRPPWFDLSQFNELLNKTMDLLNKNNYVFVLDDFNVDLTQGVETDLAMEEWFQGLIDLFFDKCFSKQSHILTYRNRYYYYYLYYVHTWYK